MSERTSWNGGRPGLPFSDIKVLDLSSFWAGPFPAMYFASLGADVIKVESVRRPDGFRFVATAPEFGSRWWERSPLFQAVNLGKRDVTLELTKSRGLDLFKRLLVDADVLIENYSPRVIEEFGLSADVVRALNPAMVMVRMPGFGLTGPWRDYVGWGLTFEQMGGCAAVTGEPDGPPLVPGGFADPVAGMHAAAAIQAALAHRESTGQGRLIEVAQVEVVACLTAEQVMQYSMNGELMVARGNRAPQMAPQGVYPCAGDDEWVALSIRDDADWECLRRALGDPAWAASPELRNVEGRMRWHDKLDAHLAAWTAPQAAAEVAQLLQRHHVPAARLLKTGDIYGEPHLEARRYFQELEHPVSGRLRFPGWPMRFSFGPSAPYAGPAPTLGQHNEEILSRILGLSSHAIEQLRQARIIGESVDG